MKNLLTLTLLAISFSVFGQFGVSTKFEINSYDNWDAHPISTGSQALEEGSFFANDISFGVNYWFRLKNKRMEFLPELNYTLKNSVSNAPNSGLNDFKMNQQRYGFRFNTHIYPLDFEGDCNCPTFSKDSEFLKKGLFIIISPGVEYMGFSTSIGDLISVEQEFKVLAFNIGFGIGVDIGISNLLTLSPFIQYNLYPSINSDAISQLGKVICPSCAPGDAENTSNRQLQFGLRFSFRPDYK